MTCNYMQSYNQSEAITKQQNSLTLFCFGISMKSICLFGRHFQKEFIEFH